MAPDRRRALAIDFRHRAKHRRLDQFGEAGDRIGRRAQFMHQPPQSLDATRFGAAPDRALVDARATRATSKADEAAGRGIEHRHAGNAPVAGQRGPSADTEPRVAERGAMAERPARHAVDLRLAVCAGQQEADPDHRRARRRIDPADHAGRIGLEAETLGRLGLVRLLAARYRLLAMLLAERGDAIDQRRDLEAAAGCGRRLGIEHIRERIGDQRDDRRRLRDGRLDLRHRDFRAVVAEREIRRAEALQRADHIRAGIVAMAQHGAPGGAERGKQGTPFGIAEPSRAQHGRGHRRPVLREDRDQPRRGARQRQRARGGGAHRRRDAPTQAAQVIEHLAALLDSPAREKVRDLPERRLRAERRGGVRSENGLQAVVESHRCHPCRRATFSSPGIA